LAGADEVYLGAVNNAVEKLCRKRNGSTPARSELQHLKTQGRESARFRRQRRVVLQQLVAATLPPSGRPRRDRVFHQTGSFDGIIGRYVAAVKK